MSEKPKLIEALPGKLGLAERFGRLAVIATIDTEYPDLPEHLRLFGVQEA